MQSYTIMSLVPAKRVGYYKSPKLTLKGRVYRYSFQGQESDNEIKGAGNSVNYKYRMHDPRIGRFFAVDPLAPKYPYWTPYAFSGNRIIDCRELEGLEPADAKKGASVLIVVIQGYGGDPQNNKTQAQNAGDKLDIDYSGIGKLQLSDSKDIQVVVYASSTTENTKNDVETTIENFNKANPKGKVVVVGHSQGADNAVELAKENSEIEIDLLITLDIKDASGGGVLSIDDDNIPENVQNVINYYQEGESIGGEKIEIDNPKKTNGANVLSPGSNHRSIDNDLAPYITTDINNFLLNLDAVKIAKERPLPTFNPEDSGSPDIDISQ